MATVDCYQTGDYGYFGIERDPDYYCARGPVRPAPVLEHIVGRPVDWMMHVCHPYFIPNQPPLPPWCCCPPPPPFHPGPPLPPPPPPVPDPFSYPQWMMHHICGCDDHKL